jgi:hypothetical protein
MDVEAQLGVNTAGFDGPMKKSAEVATATGKAVEKAAKSAADAQALAQKFASTVVSEETLKRIASMNAEKTAQKDYYQALAYTKRGLLDEASGSQAAAAALQRLTALRLEAVAAAKLQESAEGAVISKQMAASGTIRLAEGNNSIRAVERFITTIPGVGAALQSIFPIVGGIAFAGIIVDIGKKIYDVEQKAAHAAEAIQDSFQAEHDKAVVSIDDLSITNDKLQQQIDKISKTPNNGLAVALDEARKMADQLVLSLQSDRKELEGLLKDHEVGAFGSLLSGVSGTKAQGGELLADQKKLTDSVRDANQQLDVVQAATTDAKKIKDATDIRNAAVHAAFQSQIDTYAAELGRLQKEQSGKAGTSYMDAAAGVNGAYTTDNSAKIANIQGRLQQLQAAKVQEQLQESIFARTATLGSLKGDKAGKDHSAADLLKSMEDGRDAQKQIGATVEDQRGLLSAQADKEYWQARIDQFTKGSEQYRTVAKKITDDIVKQSEEAIKFRGEIFRKDVQSQKYTSGLDPKEADVGMAAFAAYQREQAEDITQTGERWKAYNVELQRTGDILIKNAEAAKAFQIEMAVKSGAKSKSDGAAAMGDIHAADSTAKITALQADLAMLTATLQALDPNSKEYQRQAPQLVAQQQSTQAAIAQEQGHGDLQAMQDQWGAFSQTAVGGAVTALGEFTAASKDSAAQMKALVDSVLSSTNGAILKDLTEKNYQRRGAWTDAGKNIFTGVAGTALKKGEGSLMGLIPGLTGAGAKLGTPGNPMYTRSVDLSKITSDASSGVAALGKSIFGANGPTAPGVSVGSGSSSSANANSAATLASGAAALGMSLFGKNGPAMPNVSPGGTSSYTAPPSGVGSLVQSLMGDATKLAAPFIPFLDSGTNYVPQDTLAMIHQGEAVVPKKYNQPGAGSSGDTHYHIDARGSSDPAQTMALVQQGIMQAAPHLIAATKSSIHSDNSRVAPANRR